MNPTSTASSAARSNDPGAGGLASTPAVDVGALMDQARFAGLPLLVSVLTTLAMIFDGFDIQIIAFAAPALLPEFGITRPQLGPILAAGLVGMAIGGFLLGQLGDRRGRRFALGLSLLVIAATSLGAATSTSPQELMWWRLATGIGLGGVVPNSAAMITEYAPLAVRNTAVAMTVVGVPLGGVLGAEVAAQLLPAYGWRALFIVGAALPLALALVVFALMPESPRYLARSGRDPEKLASLLNRIAGRSDLGPATRFEVRETEQVAGAGGVAALLSPAFRRDTLLIWLIFITNMFAVYAFFNWLPTVLASVGLPMAVALRGSLIFNLGGVVASLLLAGLVSRVGSRLTLRLVSIGAIVATLVLGFLQILPAPEGGSPFAGMLPLMTIMALTGACILGMQVIMYAVAAYAYPTAIRSTGVGWAAGMARVGGIVASFAGGLLLTLGEGTRAFFVAVALVLVPVLICAFLLQRQIPPSRAERG